MIRQRQSIEEEPVELRGTRTHENLKRYFAVDAQIAQLWSRLAQIAKLEGRSDAARLFAELDEGHAVAVGGHLDFLLGAGDPLGGETLGETASNLRAAYLSQLRDIEMLRQAAAEARNEGFPDIASWFETLANLRTAHGKKCEDLIRAAAPDEDDDQ